MLSKESSINRRSRWIPDIARRIRASITHRRRYMFLCHQQLPQTPNDFGLIREEEVVVVEEGSTHPSRQRSFTNLLEPLEHPAVLPLPVTDQLIQPMQQQQRQRQR